jgi:hypothetical protein
MISFLLGAGISCIAGVPLASELFSEEPIVDRVTRANLVSRVLHSWNSWHDKTNGFPEEYIAYLKSNNLPGYRDALWYVGLLITLSLADIRNVGGRPEIIRDQVTRTTGNPFIESFWTEVFSKTTDVAIVTTNYDIITERGIRTEPHPKVYRPGFNYGFGTVELHGGGYPTFSHLRSNFACGKIPLLKLHGSVSWSVENGSIVPYVDCRPAIRGDAAIVAPAEEKEIPDYLLPIWKKASEFLSNSETWIIIGYSLPEYDLQIRDLLKSSAQTSLNIHIFDPNPLVAERFENLLSNQKINLHPGFPNGLNDLSMILNKMPIS